MSLADELLADLEENDDSDKFMEEPEAEFIPASVSNVIEEGYFIITRNNSTSFNIYILFEILELFF